MKYVFGNWKMNLKLRESVALARSTARLLRGQELIPEVAVFPPFTALSEVRKALVRSRVKFGAQNVGTERSGAFTGEVSPAMLEDVGCSYVLVGHSERRRLFGETDVLVNARLKAVAESRMTPILCVGESAEVRAQGNAIAYVKNQLISALADVQINTTLFVAYEPVWAIGQGKAATVADVIEMHQAIREVLVYFGVPAAQVHVLYGGSVNAENAYTFLREQQVDGVLVGGASIKMRQLEGVIKAAMDVIIAQTV
jgi:triosephosphate isomerase